MRMHAMICLFVAGLVLAPSLVGTVEGRQRWTKLDERAVSDRVDHDTIRVTSSRGDFRAIQLRVKRVGVQFRDIKVHFRMGDVQDINVRAVIPAGGESRVIDLRGGDRVINRIEFWYDAQSITGRSGIVEVYGLR